LYIDNIGRSPLWQWKEREVAGVGGVVVKIKMRKGREKGRGRGGVAGPHGGEEVTFEC